MQEDSMGPRIRPEAATLEDFVVRNRTGRELCALSSAHVVPLPAGQPSLGHSPTFHS